MDLSKMRRAIDRIDAELVQLLSRRMEVAIRTKRFKNEVADTGREDEVVQRIRQCARGLVSADFAENIFRSVMAESRRLQGLDRELVAFHGEHGSLSEVAINTFNPELVGIPCRESSEIVEGLESGGVDYGVVPIENSVEGSVDQTQDLLIESDLNIVGEVQVPSQHCLLTLRETDYRDIKDVYSHPDALAQCHGFLKRNKLEGKPYYDQAGAALMLVREKPTAAAVIAPTLAAKLYDLEILKEGIQDHPSATRYLVISKLHRSEEGDKCSIVFVTPHKAGALIEALKVFSDAGVNLTKIESRPLRREPEKIAFLLDFSGSLKDARIQAVLEKLRSETAMCKVLGCYKQHGAG